MTKFRAFIDAGHGGKDPGATGHGLMEKDVVLDVVQRVVNILERDYPSIKPLLLRGSDQFYELSERTDTANNLKADCFVSIHCNSFSSSAANGFESFVYLTDGEQSKSVALQDELHPRLAKLWAKQGRKDRGKKKANFHVLREFDGASVLVELGFVSNAKDAGLLKDNSFLLQNAEALAAGIAAFFGVKKRQEISKPIYRVIVDGKQVGAFSESHNLTKAMQKAVSSGAGNIDIVKV